jgi:hypothetical protein
MQGPSRTIIESVGTTQSYASGEALLVREADPVVPKIEYYVLSINAASTANFNSSNITGGKTGRLNQIIVSSGNPSKIEVQLIDGGTNTIATMFTTPSDLTLIWSPPVGFVTIGSGSNWRVSVTNRGYNGDFYVTFIWDEF